MKKITMSQKHKSIFYFAMPFVIYICIELLLQHSFTGLFLWASGNPLPFFLGYFLILSVFSIFFAMFSSIPLSALLVSITGLGFSLINYFKMLSWNEPLYPLNLTLSGSVNKITGFVEIRADQYMAFSILLCVVTVTASFFYFPKRKNFPLRYRSIGLLASCLVIYLLCFCPSFKYDLLGAKFGIPYSGMNSEDFYRSNGFTFSFMSNLDTYNMKPKAYTEENVMKLISSIKAVQEQKSSGQLPNIIIVLSESFWDATQLSHVAFSEDPIPFFRELSKECVSGNFFSCTSGGGTANVEFEILTGFSMKNLPYGSIPYVQYVKDDFACIPRYLKEKYHYQTIAMHPFDKSFYNRDDAYAAMGFDIFLGDEDMEDIKREDIYMSDNTLADNIIAQYEQKSGPVMIHALSMQNHKPYDYDRYENYKIKLQYDTLKQNELKKLNTYVECLKYADESLKKLVEYFSSTPEPTILLFFGDHFPALEIDRQSYFDMGYTAYSGQRSEEEIYMLYTVPFVIWKNYGNERAEVNLAGGSHLGVTLLKEAGIELPLFLQFVDYFYEQIPIYANTMIRDSEELYHKTLPDSYKGLADDYKMLQYDLIFGKKMANARPD